MVAKLRATVVILTFDALPYIRRVLEGAISQEVDGDFEVLVIDSGSTDGTLKILEEFPTVRVHEIPHSEFGHGKTRNLAAQLAGGEFVAFLTHDAVPIGTGWLQSLLRPFAINDRVVAVLGSQSPRTHCFPLLKYEIEGMFAGLGSPTAVTVSYKELFDGDPVALTRASFYSDVNSATRREFLLSTIPYRDVTYAEDQLFGRDILEAGYMKAYAPQAAVEHSNDLTLHEYGKRIFDETVGLRKIGFDIPLMTRRAQVRSIVRGTLGDSFRILRDPDYSFWRKLKWLVVNPIYHLRKGISYRKSTRVDLKDREAIREGSLEHSRRKHLHFRKHG